MNVERLRAVQSEEREADSLRALPDTFYREVADYIEGLRTQRAQAAEAADDPFGAADVRRLTDEIETAEEVAEAIYERRVGKLVKRASLAAAGMPADEEGLTTEEAELFEDLVDQIEAHREEVLAAFESDRSGRDASEAVSSPVADTTDAAPPETDEVGESTLGASEAMGGGTPASESSSPGDPPPDETPPSPPEDPSTDADAQIDDASSTSEESDVDGSESTDGGEPERVTLRITRDVGEVFGVDERVYDLASEDVVTLPAANAKPLLDRNAAEMID